MHSGFPPPWATCLFTTDNKEERLPTALTASLVVALYDPLGTQWWYYYSPNNNSNNKKDNNNSNNNNNNNNDNSNKNKIILVLIISMMNVTNYVASTEVLVLHLHTPLAPAHTLGTCTHPWHLHTPLAPAHTLGTCAHPWHHREGGKDRVSLLRWS